MPAFSYRAVDATGKKAKGVLDAVNEASVRADLRKRHLLPLSVEATKQHSGLSGSPRRHRLTLKRQVLVTRQLATLVGAQVRIEDAIHIVAE